MTCRIIEEWNFVDFFRTLLRTSNNRWAPSLYLRSWVDLIVILSVEASMTIPTELQDVLDVNHRLLAVQFGSKEPAFRSRL